MFSFYLAELCLETELLSVGRLQKSNPVLSTQFFISVFEKCYFHLYVREVFKKKKLLKKKVILKNGILPLFCAGECQFFGPKLPEFQLIKKKYKTRTAKQLDGTKGGVSKKKEKTR